MATIDIKNPEIHNAPGGGHRYHNNSQMNNIVHSTFPKKEKKVKVQLIKFIKPEVDRAWLEVPYLLTDAFILKVDLQVHAHPKMCLFFCRKPLL